MSRRLGLVERVWARQGIGRPLSLLLLPASWLFRTGVLLRGLVRRVLRGKRLPAAVVSVGNLTVGGTGKTPTAIWVASELAARGRRVAIVSRGYGGTARRPTIVSRVGAGDVEGSEDWRVVGDEAVLLARRFGGPVVVARRRHDAGKIACEVFGADVLVLDDGFQHRRLARDFDLVLVRAGSLANRRLLPAGPFREPLSALRRAQAVLITKGNGEEPAESEILRARGGMPIYHGDLRVSGLVTAIDGEWRDVPMGQIVERTTLALSGVADPDPFYRVLHEWGAQPRDFLVFPDHHAYTLDDWKAISHRSRELELVATTEKDLVKLAEFPFANGKLVALRVSMDVSEGDDLIDRIDAVVGERLANRAKGDR